MNDLSPGERRTLAWALGVLGLEREAPLPPIDTSALRRWDFGFVRRWAPYTVVSIDRCDGCIVARLADARARPFTLQFRVAGEALVSLAVGRPLAAGVVLREAGASDVPAMAALERDSPIEIEGGGRFAIFRPKLAHMHRLQEHTYRAVIERGGKIVACRVLAVRTLRLGGKEVRLSTSQMARVLPEARGSHLMQGFMLWESEIGFAATDAVVAYVDPGNAAAMGSFRSEDAQWKRTVLELTLSCDALAGPDTGRQAEPSDAARIAALANAAHGGSALYCPADACSVTARLTRAPDAYSWRDVLLGQRSMLGVWASLDETLETRANGQARSRVLSIALDYGFDGSQGLSELRALLGAHATRMRAAGASHIVLYTWPGAATARLLAPLAEEHAEIAVQSRLPEPADAAGVYTDPLYL